jgi:hypothetical protein
MAITSLFKKLAVVGFKLVISLSFLLAGATLLVGEVSVGSQRADATQGGPVDELDSEIGAFLAKNSKPMDIKSYTEKIQNFASRRKKLCATDEKRCLNSEKWAPYITSSSNHPYFKINSKLVLSLFSSLITADDMREAWKYFEESNENEVTGTKIQLSLNFILLQKAPLFSAQVQIADWLIGAIPKWSETCLKLTTEEEKNLCIVRLSATLGAALVQLEKMQPLPYEMKAKIAMAAWNWASSSAVEALLEKLNPVSMVNLLREASHSAYVVGNREKVIDLFKKKSEKMSFEKLYAELPYLFEDVCTSYRDLGQYDKCLALVDSQKLLKNALSMQIEKAISLYKQGKFSAARKLYKEILSRAERESPGALTSLALYEGFNEYADKDFKRAQLLLDQFSNSAGKSEMMQFNGNLLRIKLLGQQGKYLDAKKAYEDSEAILFKYVRLPYYDYNILQMNYLLVLLRAKDRVAAEVFAKNILSLDFKFSAVQYFKKVAQIVEKKIAGGTILDDLKKLEALRGPEFPETHEFVELINAF